MKVFCTKQIKKTLWRLLLLCILHISKRVSDKPLYKLTSNTASNSPSAINFLFAPRRFPPVVGAASFVDWTVVSTSPINKLWRYAATGAYSSPRESVTDPRRLSKYDRLHTQLLLKYLTKLHVCIQIPFTLSLQCSSKKNNYKYSTDIQMQGSCRPDSVDSLQSTLSDCPHDVSDWMRSKTKILWCSTSRWRHLLPTTAVRVSVDYITPSSAVRDLGIMIDSDVSMRSHVSRTVSGCFATLRQIRSVRRSVSVSVFMSLVVSVIMPRLHYGNATLAVYRSISTADYSQCSTPPPDWSTGKVGASTSHRSCESFTGFGPDSVLTSNLPSSSSGVFMV